MIDREMDSRPISAVAHGRKAAAAQEQHSPRTRATMAAKKEVEANPFKKLIDISDLIEFEANPLDVEKEVQNIMLRHNSDLKGWYRTYARKVEATKSEESFSMTLRQVWRFLRDCGVPSHDATLATFNRVYNSGKKNHFTLLGTHEVAKFNLMYGLHAEDGSAHFARLLTPGNNVACAQPKASGSDSDFEEEDEGSDDQQQDIAAKLGIEPENVHGPARIVLQRQFFEAIVRAAYVKYANNSELPTLADKLDHLFKHKLVPNACKTKAKTPEEEVSQPATLTPCCRNNSRSPRRPSTSTPSSPPCSTTSAAATAKTPCRATRPSLLAT